MDIGLGKGATDASRRSGDQRALTFQSFHGVRVPRALMGDNRRG
jgi:hypothetical protein